MKMFNWVKSRNDKTEMKKFSSSRRASEPSITRKMPQRKSEPSIRGETPRRKSEALSQPKILRRNTEPSGKDYMQALMEKKSSTLPKEYLAYLGRYDADEVNTRKQKNEKREKCRALQLAHKKLSKQMDNDIFHV